MESLYLYKKIDELKKVCQEKHINLSNFAYLNTCSENLNYSMTCKYPLLYFTLWEDNNLIGVLKQCVINQFDYNKNEINDCRFISFIVINNFYQGKGYSKKLLKYYFQFLQKNNLNELSTSPYTKKGFLRIRKHILKFSEEFNINIKDSGYCFQE